VSLVVVAASSEPHLLRGTLQSARQQQTPMLEILVVCLDPEARAVAEAVAGDDTRVRLFDAPTVQAARRLGASRSKGARVALAAPGDVYPPGAVQAALQVTADPAVPVVLARVGEPGGAGGLTQVPVVAESLRLGRLLLERPLLATLDDALAEDGDLDGAPTAAALLRGGFVLGDRPAYQDARGTPPPPHSARRDPLPALGARVARDRAALAALDGFHEARAHFAASAVAALAPFLEAAEVALPDTWRALSVHARHLLDVADERAQLAPVLPRALARLAADDRREDLLALVARRRFAGEDFPTTAGDGVVHALLGVDLDEPDLRLGERETGLRAVVRRLRLVKERLELEVLGGLRHVDQTDPPVVEAVLRDHERVLELAATTGSDAGVTRWFGETEHDHDAGLLTLTLPADELESGSWSIELRWRTDGLVRTAVVEEIDGQGSAARRPLRVGAFGVRLRSSPGGAVLVVGPPPTDGDGHDVESVEIGATALHVTLRGEPDGLFLDAEGRHVDAVRGHDGVWVVPLRHDSWGLGERPLPSGSYRLHVQRGPTRSPAVLAPSLVDRVPEDARTTEHRVRWVRGHGDALVVRLDPLLLDEEAGARAQRRLQRDYLAIDEPLDERLVYFQSFTGQWAADHPFAIQQELVRRRPDLDVRWAVADSSARVPDGAEPVLLRSREWYDVLARARHLVVNVELDRWFRRRPGQQLLQCFHGYPSKTMGLGLWRSRGLLPSHLEQQLDHTSRTWNALLTPDPAMDRYYREEYAYDGRILALGYPRDDVLVGPGAEELRADTRRRLGIAPGQRAVLYAPTWRDDLATNFRAAEAVHHLDVEQAASLLGDEYVLLLRGHRFHAAGPGAGSRVVDVTAYPDVNHLILAADAAVLDYSSMRFDFALTGRPMVFLVPDLDDYGARTRGFLWDFGETAPGPWVRDTAGVVAELRDVDALAERWAEPIAAFNTRYNSLQDGHAAERVVTAFFSDLPVA
jgi:CDP-glycerol glycerophosphotransferase (TagB/SpsB family)